MTHQLGVGLIPSKKSLDSISRIKDKMINFYPNFEDNSENIPHMTIFQGRFADSMKVISKMEEIHSNFYLNSQISNGVEIWNKKWVFLNVFKSESLKKLHYDTLYGLCQLRKGKAIDFLDESAMTIGQRKSFYETGYQFSKEEFSPHITLFKLDGDCQEVSEISDKINECMPELFLNEIKFKKLVVYKTGEEGSCLDTIFEGEI